MGNDEADDAPELDDPSVLDADDEGTQAPRKRARKDSIELIPSVPGSWPRFDSPPEPPPQPTNASPALLDMRDRHMTGDFTGALAAAEAILRQKPDHSEARRCAANCRQVLMQMYSARLGPFEQVPKVVVSREQVRWLSLDHRAGFVLSLIDGRSNIDQILDLAGMPRLDTVRVLYTLLEQRVIALGARS
jgi:hypothetical protein